MGIKYIIYMLYVIGVLLWQYPVFYSILTVGKNRILIHRKLKKYTKGDEFRKLNSLEAYISKVIDGADARKVFVTTRAFFILSVVCGVIGFIFSFMIGGIILAIISGIFTGISPYLILVTRLNKKRVLRSQEGYVLVQELLNNYKVYSYNIKEAVEVTANTIEQAPYGKKIVLELSKALNYAVTKPEVDDALEQFYFAFHSSWARVLAVDISFAHLKGIRIDSALSDLLDSIVISKSLMEREKQENNEARLMLKYLAPITYVLSIFCACKFFNYTIIKFFYYQFMTSTGLQWFTLMMISYTVGLFINGILGKGKLDI